MKYTWQQHYITVKFIDANIVKLWVPFPLKNHRTIMIHLSNGSSGLLSTIVREWQEEITEILKTIMWFTETEKKIQQQM